MESTVGVGRAGGVGSDVLGSMGAAVGEGAGVGTGMEERAGGVTGNALMEAIEMTTTGM